MTGVVHSFVSTLNPQREIELVKLEQSGLAHQFVEERYPQKWDDDDFQGLVADVQSAGLSLQPADIGQLIEELHAYKKEAERRIRENVMPTIPQMQTPLRQADAAFADPADFDRRFHYQDGDFFLGRSAHFNNPLGEHDERHVFLCAGSRSNKGTGVIIPNHLLWEGSLVSLDPKGENATVAAARRGSGNDYCIGLGQQTCVIDPFNKAKGIDQAYRCRFNPLDELSVDDPDWAKKSASIATSIVPPKGGEKDSMEYFNNDTRGMMQALILHIVSSPHFEGRRDLVTLRQLILHGDREALAEYRPPIDLDTGKPKRKPDPQSFLFSLMMQNPAFDGEVAGAGRALLAMQKTGKAQWAGVDGGLRTYTDWLRDPRIKDCVRWQKKPDFRLSEIKNHPTGMSLFICVPEDTDQTYAGWQRMMLNLIAIELQQERGMCVRGKRVLMCLDEFAALEKMSTFQRGVAHFAGNGVKMVFVLQNLTQIKSIYKENWEDFLGNSSVKMFFDMGDITTPDTVSKFMGEIELIRYAETHGVAAAEGDSLAIGKAKTRNNQASRQLGLTGGHGVNKSDGKTFGTNKFQSTGGSHTDNQGGGSSVAGSYDQNRLFFRGIQKQIGIFRGNEKTSVGSSSHYGSANSKQWGQGSGEQHGRQRTIGSQSQEGFNLGYGEVKGEGDNNSITGTKQNTITRNGSIAEQYAKRALANPDELRKWFARILDRAHPYYPGLALVVVSAEDPHIIRRVNYYEDDFFDGLRDRDPVHPDSDPLPVLRTVPLQIPGDVNHRGGLWFKHEGTMHEPTIAKWHKKPNEPIKKGELLLEVQPGTTASGLVDTLLPVYAPESGWVERHSIKVGEVFAFERVLGSLRCHIGTMRREVHMANLNQLIIHSYNVGEHTELRKFQHALAEHEAAKAERERIEKKRQDDDLEYRIYVEEQHLSKLRGYKEERRKYGDAWFDFSQFLSVMIGIGTGVCLLYLSYLMHNAFIENLKGAETIGGIMFIASIVIAIITGAILLDELPYKIWHMREKYWDKKNPEKVAALAKNKKSLA